ncbi:Sensor histidine kinase LiaS [compost metagenome]
MGLEVALRDMLERKLSNLKMSFNLSYQVRETQLTSNIEMVIYRIVQELLNNTIKHAEAGHVNVSVQQKENELYLTYTDNGKGMNRDMLSDSGKGFGLKSITNRLHTLNGVMEILSEPAKGTKVFMNIPLYATD